MPNLAERKAALRCCEKCKAYLIASSPQFSVCSDVNCRSKLQPRLSVMDRNRWRAYILIKAGMPEAVPVTDARNNPPLNTPPLDKCCRFGLYKIGEVLYQRLKRLDMVDEKLGDVIAIDGYARGGFRLFQRKGN